MTFFIFHFWSAVVCGTRVFLACSRTTFPRRVFVKMRCPAHQIQNTYAHAFLQCTNISLFMPTPLKPYKLGVACVSLCSSSLGNFEISYLLWKRKQVFYPHLSFVNILNMINDNYVLMSDLLQLKGGVGGTFLDLERYAICDSTNVAMDHAAYSNLPTATLLSILYLKNMVQIIAHILHM